MKPSYKKAFTLIEILIVLVLIGILSTIAYQRTNQSNVLQAANQLVSHLRLTQYLALTDHKFHLTDKEWYKRRWQWRYGQSAVGSDGKLAYVIYSEESANPNESPAGGETAVDPLTGYIINGGVGVSSAKYNNITYAKNNANIENTYGVNSITLSSSCNDAQKISFDYLGRPYKGNFITNPTYDQRYKAINLITATCHITLSDGDINNDRTICIEPYTGYIHLCNP